MASPARRRRRPRRCPLRRTSTTRSCPILRSGVVVDGGVIWTSVPAGVYTIRARHPDTRFARFVATCEPGRIVNANPPWGCTSSASGCAPRCLPAGRSAAPAWPCAACASRRFRGEPLRVCAARADCARSTRAGCGRGGDGSRRRSSPGQTIAVRITAPGHGKLIRWRLRVSRTPVRVVRCVPLGNRAPRPRC